MNNNPVHTIRIRFVLFLFICSNLVFQTSCSEKLISEIHTYENGSLNSIEYLDIHGNIVERVRFADGLQILKEEYVYIDNRIRAAQFTSADESKSTIEYFYENDQLMRIRFFSGNKISRLIVFRYDEYGRMFSEMHFDLKNELRNATHFHYDSTGTCIAKVIISKDSLPTQEFYSFDGSKNIISSVSVYGNDTVKMLANAYNRKNQLIESIEYQYGSFVKKIKYSYSSKGLLNKVYYFDSHGYIVREEQTEYNRHSLKEKKIITDYRNFEGDSSKVVDVFIYKYEFF